MGDSVTVVLDPDTPTSVHDPLDSTKTVLPHTTCKWDGLFGVALEGVLGAVHPEIPGSQDVPLVPRSTPPLLPFPFPSILPLPLLGVWAAARGTLWRCAGSWVWAVGDRAVLSLLALLPPETRGTLAHIAWGHRGKIGGAVGRTYTHPPMTQSRQRLGVP